MKLRFFSDPHMGVVRRANTMVQSRKMLQARIKTMLDHLTVHSHHTNNFCLGDLFDTYRVPEEVLLEAYELMPSMINVLTGNHDVTNDSSAVGSLQLLGEIFKAEKKVTSVPYGKAGFEYMPCTLNTLVMGIPHCTTQEKFEFSLQKAFDHAQQEEYEHKILLLHCNYNRPEGFTSETELNLTESDAETLCTVFDHVLLGHEHNWMIQRFPDASEAKGMVWVVGNVFPTSFSDISDKQSLIFDTEDGSMRQEFHWLKDKHYLEVNWKSLTEANLEEIEFLDLTGKVTSDEIYEVSEVIRSAWKRGPMLLAVRDSTEASTGMFHMEHLSLEELRQESFAAFLDARLPGDLKDIWLEVKNAAAN